MINPKEKMVHVHFTFSRRLKEELEKNVGKRKMSLFVAEATSKELKKLEMASALNAGFGAWKDKDHPELAGNKAVYKYVRSLREESEKRLRRK
ncbi:MAG: hypothetical protein M1365_17210 [Actinobacteria bacterium]|nr:hypothetical protein [Actinomycetota bacterium]